MTRARDIADFGSVTARLDTVGGSSGALSNRNLIINGGMQVNQRGNSTGVTAEGYHGPDRFQFSESGRDQFQVSISQASDGPDGYSNSYKVQATTAESAIDASEYVLVRQVVEAQNLQHLKYGTSSAQQLTASFWVKSSIAATFGVFMYQYDGGRIIGSTYTINSANTWEYKTVTFAGDTGGTINDDNGNGQYLAFTLAAGSDARTTDNTSWSAYAGGKLGYGHTTAANAVMTTTNATWQITGVQLEVGDTATDFEHRTFDDERRRCQRYFEILYNDSESAANLAVFSATTAYGNMHFIEKRADPTMIMSAASTMRIRSGGANTNLTSIEFNGAVKSGNGRVSVSVASGLTTGHAGWLSRSGSGTAYIYADAEL